MSSKKPNLGESPPTTTTANRFDLLRNFDDVTEPSSNTAATVGCDKSTNNSQKTSFPIKVVGKDITAVQNVLTAAGIVSFLTKKMSIGTKVVVNSLSLYKLVKDALDKAAFQYYTHDLPDDRSFKVILQGLDNRAPDDIKKALNDLQIKCKDVKVVVKKYDNLTEWLYIVYLENGSIRLQELRDKVKSLFRTIVRWDYQRKIKGKLVQCRNCQMFGHGERGCSIKTRCANCAGCHKTADCKTPDSNLCINCKQQHKSTDASCQHRISYAELKQKIQQRNKPKTSSSSNAFNFNAKQFPTLRKATTPNVVNFNYEPTTSRNQSWAGVVSSNNGGANGDLFTEDEITRLTFDVVMGLRECKSKFEQFQVITQIAIKYLGCYSQP